MEETTEVTGARPFRVSTQNIRKYPVQVKAILTALYPFVGRKNTPVDRWVAFVIITDRNRMDDFGLAPEQLAAVYLHLGIIAEEDTLVWNLAEEMAANVAVFSTPVVEE